MLTATRTSSDPNPVLIVGMARSGTSVLANMFGAIQTVHLEVEPHALWKSGNFRYLNDEDFDLREAITADIRRKLLSRCQLPNLVEKSPINCLRPELVHRVFPEARVIYLNREPQACVYSNYRRTLAGDSFKLSLLLRKYSRVRISPDLPYATSKRSILGQLGRRDLFQFPLFCLKMFSIRSRMKQFPFGPKLRDFEKMVQTHGVVGYHALVLKTAIDKKADFKSLYEDRLMEIDFEDITKETFRHVLEFADIDYTEAEFRNAWQTWNPSRNNEQRCCGSHRGAVEEALRQVGL